MRKIEIFDTTLRDGEQTPGVSLIKEEKVEAAKQLSKLGVDVIEAGFPAASQGDFQAVREIAGEVKGTTITGLARANPKDIDLCQEALKEADSSRLHIFIATSDIHMKYKLKKSKSEVLEDAVKMIQYARGKFDEIQFSPEDGGSGRTDFEFLVDIVEAAIDAGADVINIPDTVGYQTPDLFYGLIKNLRDRVNDVERAKISVHCHDDLGMAVANSLAGVLAGAKQVETAINGIGERAGNASLEEIVMALKTRNDYYQADTDINTERIYRTSRMISKLTGVKIPPNKAIVGDNAFAHESGIHQHGVLEEKTTYEIMTPESVGVSSNKLVIGKHSGKHAFKAKLEELGFHVSEEQVKELFKEFKNVADQKKNLTDEDIEAIVEDKLYKPPEIYQWMDFQVQTGNRSTSTATVSLNYNAKEVTEAACGKGPVDAIYQTIKRIVNEPIVLKDYAIKSVTSGTDALGEVNVKLECDGIKASGRGLSADTLEASGKAYVNAINKILYKRSEYDGDDHGREDLG